MLPRLLTGLVTAVLATGCYECNLENCKDGCCSDKGVCVVAPTSDLECGLGGLLCQDCTQKPGNSCLQSTCQPRCNNVTCLGCCTQTGACVAPSSQTDTACGERGSTCVSCTANQFCERLAPTTAGKCCGRAGKPCTTSYDCCSGTTCRATGGGNTCQ